MSSGVDTLDPTAPDGGGGNGGQCGKPPTCCAVPSLCQLMGPDVPNIAGALDSGGGCHPPPPKPPPPPPPPPPWPPRPCLDGGAGIDLCPPPPPGHTKGAEIGGPFPLDPIPSDDGPSPLTLIYDVPLGTVPPGARIVRIAPLYHCPVSGAVISDTWGVANIDQVVEWSALGVGQANASMATRQVRVAAQCSFSTAPFGSFWVDKVLIYWFDPDMGYD